MKLTRGKRIALELLGPPFVGTVLLSVVSAVWKSARDETLPPKLDDFQFTGFIMFLSYVIGGLPSIAYTCLMEWRFARGLKPGSWKAVTLATCLGTIAGVFIGFVVTEPYDQSAFWIIMMGGIGLTVGSLLGLLIKHWSTEKKTTGVNPP